MMVLRILGIVLCVVLLVFVVLTAFTLFAPARIEIKRDMPNGQLKVRLGFGPIKKVFRLGGKRKKTKKIWQPSVQRAHCQALCILKFCKS